MSTPRSLMEIVDITPCSGWWVIVLHSPQRYPQDVLPLEFEDRSDDLILRGIDCEYLAAWAKCRDQQGDTYILGTVPTERGTLTTVWDAYPDVLRAMLEDEAAWAKRSLVGGKNPSPAACFLYETRPLPPCPNCRSNLWWLNYGKLVHQTGDDRAIQHKEARCRRG
jgi:hypothetical protein